jgi:hypothetical protein
MTRRCWKRPVDMWTTQGRALPTHPPAPPWTEGKGSMELFRKAGRRDGCGRPREAPWRMLAPRRLGLDGVRTDWKQPDRTISSRHRPTHDERSISSVRKSLLNYCSYFNVFPCETLAVRLSAFVRRGAHEPDTVRITGERLSLARPIHRAIV